MRTLLLSAIWALGRFASAQKEAPEECISRQLFSIAGCNRVCNSLISDGKDSALEEVSKDNQQTALLILTNTVLAMSFFV